MQNTQSTTPTTKVNFQDIETHLHALREECMQEISHATDSREEAYLRAAVDVLEGLERSFHRYYEERGHITSPKSTEPWD